MYTLLTYLLLAFIGFTSFVTSVPIYARDVCSEGNGLPGGVYMCPLDSFLSSTTYKCQWWPPNPYFCHDLAEDGKAGFATSIGPDPGGYCLFYMEENCEGEPSEIGQTEDEIDISFHK
jgi:hypothetical protein